MRYVEQLGAWSGTERVEALPPSVFVQVCLRLYPETVNLLL
jgi:hypothetical protein